MRKLMEMSEYSALRDELISRISLINSQENTALTTTIGFWAASVVLLAVNPQTVQDKLVLQIALNLLQALILIIPIVLMVPIACKSGENLYQISVMSSYIKIFYEYASLTGTGEKPLTGVLCWELVNDVTSMITDNTKQRECDVIRKKHFKRRYLKWLNNSYTVLAAISIILYAFESAYLLVRWYNVLNGSDFIVLFGILSFFMIISIILLFIIRKESSVMTNFISPKKEAIRIFLKKAKAVGIILSDDLKMYENTAKKLQYRTQPERQRDDSARRRSYR